MSLFLRCELHMGDANDGGLHIPARRYVVKGNFKGPAFPGSHGCRRTTQDLTGFTQNNLIHVIGKFRGEGKAEYRLAATVVELSSHRGYLLVEKIFRPAHLDFPDLNVFRVFLLRRGHVEHDGSPNRGRVPVLQGFEEKPKAQEDCGGNDHTHSYGKRRNFAFAFRYFRVLKGFLHGKISIPAAVSGRESSDEPAVPANARSACALAPRRYHMARARIR